jgi:chain length determinant protein EpsF
LSLRQLLLIVKARWKTVLFTILFFVAIAVSLNFIFSPRYTATTTVVVDFKNGMDPILGVILPQGQGYFGTQLQIMQSHKVAVDVVRRLKLDENAAAKAEWREETGGRGTLEDWLAELLLKKQDVKPAREGTTVDISFTGVDPQFSAIVADAFAEAYQKTVLELRVDPAKQSAIWFDEQIRKLKGDLERAQSNLNKYQREKGIVATDERLDVENSRLSELSAQMVNAQTAAYDSATRLKQLDEFLAQGANPANLPDILANPLLQSMKAQLAQSEARLDQISSQLGANHPDVRKLRADIDAQRRKIKDEIANVAAGMRNTERIAQRREAELRQAVANQKSKLLQYNQSRDELAVLLKEADTAQRAYDAASQRFTQQSLESQASQTNISILNHARPPLGPSFPKIGLNVAIAIVIGIFIGINMAVLRELMDRRIRSLEDFKGSLSYPVLGRVDGIRVPRTRTRKLPWRKQEPSLQA